MTPELQELYISPIENSNSKELMQKQQTQEKVFMAYALHNPEDMAFISG